MPPPPSQPPVGTRHKVKPPKKPWSTKLAALEKELEELPSLIKKKFKKWTNGARDFQLKCMRAQVLKQDVLLQAATGSGKTGIAAGPHLLPSSEGKVTLMVSPLLALENEQVATFHDEFRLKAIAINSENGGCLPSIAAKIISGEYQIVLLSPELLVSRKFIDDVLRKPAFGSRCLAVFIDEAHCVSHWGASFRKAYSSIGVIRAFLPRETPVIAVTATLTPAVHQDLLTKLQFDPNSYLFANEGNDRPNVSQVVRAMEHPASSFRDLDFLIPTAMASTTAIQKGFVYCDDIKAGAVITDYLNQRVDPQFRKLGLIRPYNASMSKKYRKRVMQLFREGHIRILVCTDAAGMGCDIPDVSIVVQWKAAENLSSWVQRAGRAARGWGRTGLAVMIVEKSAFEAAAVSPPPTVAPGRRTGRDCGKGGGEHAIEHGLKRGTYGGQHDTVVPLDEAHITSDVLRDAKGEGLYFYVQTTRCRREILRTVFRNEPSGADQALCCDICNPGLFDHVRPSKPQQATRQRAPKRTTPVDSVRTALYTWRREMKTKYWQGQLWGPQAILSDNNCELLASVGPIESEVFLASILQDSWAWWDKLGGELYLLLNSLAIPALPARTTSRSLKRLPDNNPSAGSSSSTLLNTSPTKRARIAQALPSSTSSDPPQTGSEQPPNSCGTDPASLPFPPSSYDIFFSQFNRRAN
ncbi:hypothetical protein CVT26_009680 [Gymnopilus dilepis]|uniref:DNA 3'-5' helicase n=1 Tax=Gymnopilus dilepis TaxID=231916 RepID=A0A409WCM5_9AGAR|nr:hypothetical protein CVT26_009680 [Gymnopilus dilepis]